ncbi:MAG: histidine phosphatase family protein [Bradyrhizobium sp.]|nr:histidine phosphatase family protein [Bradyrhizobium sp.]
MRRLMLLRHAKTESDSPSGRDRDRRLDERGRRDAAEIGDFIASHPPVPDSVLISPAVRAYETWERAWAAMKDRVPRPRVELQPDLYCADSAQLLQSIREVSPRDAQRLMVIGHNPGMHELALALTDGGDAAGRRTLADNLPTSGLAIFDFAIDDWSDVAFRRGRLVLFVSPKLLRQTLGE